MFPLLAPIPNFLERETVTESNPIVGSLTCLRAFRKVPSTKGMIGFDITDGSKRSGYRNARSSIQKSGHKEMQTHLAMTSHSQPNG